MAVYTGKAREDESDQGLQAVAGQGTTGDLQVRFRITFPSGGCLKAEAGAKVIAGAQPEQAFEYFPGSLQVAKHPMAQGRSMQAA